jgi:hypothetical protein
MERRQFLQSTGLGAAATMLGVAPLTAVTTHLSFLKENVMSEQPRPYEPLTSENAALILIDHQVGLMTGFAIIRQENSSTMWLALPKRPRC